MIEQFGKVAWQGDIKGHADVTTKSGVLNAVLSTRSRFEGQKGTNPEELIGAAHASCYTMFLNDTLGKQGYQVEGITTTSTVTLDADQKPPKVVKIHVSTEGQVPGITPEEFQKQAEYAKEHCPISQLLKAVPEMTLDAKLA